ncbi:MAG: chitobiase/beta-hexosaminidase C-terminal domain-containing protein [Solirubrobacteraceae bacterium]
MSLTFDDGLASQAVVPSMLSAHAMLGTFYVPSGLIDTPGHLTWGQLASFAADGEEIGGHTVDHTDLTTVTTQQARYEVCEDRARLLNFGFDATDFAYPQGAGADDATINSIVEGCGYNSARAAWGLTGGSCPTCTAWAESIPPANPWAILTADNPTDTTTLAQIEAWVTNAESYYSGSGPGWVVLVFHDICDGCAADGYSTSPSIFSALLSWLAADPNVTVKTVQQVIGGTTQPSPGTLDTAPPAASIACNGATCSAGWYATPVQVSLSASDTGGSGVEAIRFTTDGSDPTLLSPVYTGPFTVSESTTVRYRAWDNAGNADAVRAQSIRIDAAAPTSSISCNGTACSGGWYTAPVQVSLSADDAGGSGVDVIRFTTDGSEPNLASPLYTGPFTVGSTTTISYRAWDVVGNEEAVLAQRIAIDATAPVVAITSPRARASVKGKVRIAVAASDSGSGIASVSLYADSKLIGTVAGAPYVFQWSTTREPAGQYRLTAIAADAAGNVTRSSEILVALPVHLDVAARQRASRPIIVRLRYATATTALVTGKVTIRIRITAHRSRTRTFALQTLRVKLSPRATRTVRIRPAGTAAQAKRTLDAIAALVRRGGRATATLSARPANALAGPAVAKASVKLIR